MSNAAIVLAGPIPATQDVWYDDIALTPGSLALFKPSFSARNLSAVPASGGSVYNVAWQQAAALIPGGTETNLASTVNYVGMTGARGLLEITSKGGLHALKSQSADQSGDYFRVNASPLIRDYLFNNASLYTATPTGRKYAASIWIQYTRLANPTTTPLPLLSMINGNYAQFLLQMENVAANPVAEGPTHLDSPGYQQLGLTYRGMNMPRGWRTTKPANSSAVLIEQFSVGGDQKYLTPALNKSFSAVCYQSHIVDLDAAGLTAAQWLFFDQCLYQCAISTSIAGWLTLNPDAEAVIKAIKPGLNLAAVWFAYGGKLAGDTFTAVASLP